VPERRTLLAGAARADDYVNLAEGVGLYAITRIPFWYGVDGWQKEAAETMRRSKEDIRVRDAFALRAGGRGGTQAAKEILAVRASHPLGIPQLSA